MTGFESGRFSSAELKSRLAVIIKFLPIFQRDGFVFGVWNRPAPEGGITQFPWITLDDASMAFIQAAYDADWVIGFDWPKWAQTAEAKKLCDDPAKLSRATPQQLAKLLTVCIRQDRFAEGALLEAFESGLLTAILERASVLQKELD